MHISLEKINTNLITLNEQIVNQFVADSKMVDHWGWQFPSLSKYELGYMAISISDKLQKYDIENVEESLLPIIEDIPNLIQSFTQNSLPYFYNGHGPAAIQAYFELIAYIRVAIEPIFSWESLQDNKAMPKELSRKLRAIQADLNEITPEKDKLREQIDLINKATSTAETLPTDLESLKEARIKVENHLTESAKLFGKIDTYNKDGEKISLELQAKLIEAEKIVSQCNQAYRIATTEGLAAAFDQRAKKLTYSVWYWVIGLLIALGAAIWIGHERFKTINEALNNTEKVVESGKIWIQISLSIFSLGAPIWFAWIATKQINQRFKLSEDYAFKASVAKAYEGYKLEAARLDATFENRLFGSALSRLEEAPLRLMDNDHYSSPWQELLDSPKFKDIWTLVPELKSAMIDKLKTMDLKTSKVTKSNNENNQDDSDI
jgi:hypothetical protein